MKTISCKALSLLLIFSLLCSFLPVSELSALAAADSGSPFGVVPDSNAKLAGALDGEFAGGDGTSDNPYLIETADQLKNVKKYTSSCFKLIADITANNLSPLTSIALGSPEVFTGVFDGNDKTVSFQLSTKTLTIPQNAYQLGLFSNVGKSGTIKNLYIADTFVEDKSDIEFVGILAGLNDGLITNCHIQSSKLEGTALTEAKNVGGMIGLNRGTVTDCDVSGDFSGTTDAKVTIDIGGLIGWNQGKVSNCSSNAAIYGNRICGGGLIGIINTDGAVESCQAKGTVQGDATSVKLGGFVGFTVYGSTITDCDSETEVTGSAADDDSGLNIGGFSGYSSGTITNCHATGSVKATGSKQLTVGGFSGLNTGNISASSAKGDVISNGKSIVASGGFVGFFSKYNDDPMILDCSAEGSVTIEEGGVHGRAGGFVGQCQGGSIKQSKASGEVKVSKSANVKVGGFVGVNTNASGVKGFVASSYSTGNVTADAQGTKADSKAGGFVGNNSSNSEIIDCYSTGKTAGSAVGDVTAVAIGGYAAANYGTIKNAYATGMVSGSSASAISSVKDVTKDTFTSGVTSGSAMSVSGFTALNAGTGTIENCFFDTQTTQKSDGVQENYNTGSVSLKALKTTKMTGDAAKDNMTGLDFTGTWKTTANTKQAWYYPQLESEKSLDHVTIPIIITGFADLDESIKTQKKYYKDVLSKALLPDKINATANGIYNIEISTAKWNNNMPEIPAEGTYTFEPDLTGYTVKDGVAAPIITVQASADLPAASAFAALPSDVAVQNVANGTEKSSLNLPGSLEATVEGKAVTITGVTWSSSPAYYPNVAGTYIFTPILSGYDIPAGVKAPTITVNVARPKITDFVPLIPNVVTQNVTNGTERALLNLPASLGATVDGVNKTISGITWTESPAYQPNTAGTYTFTAVLPAGYTLGAGVSTPKITVNIASPKITSFTPLIPNVVTQNVANGTARTSLNLPASLGATVDGVNKTISGITWTESPAYQPNTAGAYTFTAVLPAGYTLGAGVSMPTIAVTVAAKQENKSSSGSSTTPPVQPKNQTETKVDSTGNTATVTTKPERVITNGNTASIEAVIPSVVLDNTQSPTAGSTVDTGKKAAVMIQLPSVEIKQQLVAKNNVELTVTVPSEAVQKTNPNLAVTISADKGILEAAKTSLSDVTIKIKDADTQQLAYSWTFKGVDLAKSTVPVTDVNIAMSVRLTTEVSKVNAITPDKKGLVLSFDHSGVLPSVASVKISALEKGFKPGQMLYFYYFNPVTKQIEPQSEDPYVVDAEGNVTVPINHCSDYVLLPNAVRALVLDTLTYTMPQNGKYEIGVTLTGAAGQTVQAYSSTNGIAKVERLKNGNYRVTALKPGLTYIMFDVYDSKNKKIIKSHASVRLTVKKGTVPSGNSTRQVAVF